MIFKNMKDVIKHLDSLGVNHRVVNVPQPDVGIALHNMLEVTFLDKLDGALKNNKPKDIYVYLMSVDEYKSVKAGIEINETRIRCFVAEYGFSTWIENYRKNGFDDRGYAYPIVEAAWNAGFEQGKKILAT